MSLADRRVLVVGLGSIGRRHVQNLLALGVGVAVLRRAPDGIAGREVGVETFTERGDAIAWAPDAVIVATPTADHVATSRWAVSERLHVLVEKPLSHDLNGVDELIDDANAAGRCLAVAQNLRFHPALEAIREAITRGEIGRLLSARAEVGQYLPDWHPSEDYRESYASRSELGGGALLTLSHELDLVLWIAGAVERVSGASRKGSSLEIDVDDIAEIVCLHKSGTVSSVHADLVDRDFNRRSRWIGETGTISWEWSGPAKLVRGDRSRTVLWEDPAFDLNETYLAELRDFLDASADGRSARTTGEAGRALLVVCDQVADWSGVP